MVDYALVYAALEYFKLKTSGSIAAFVDFEKLPEDVKPLLLGNNGYAGAAALKTYLDNRENFENLSK